jgi:ubiquinone/menaquinone biosynthesis C-methylase UbiE
MNYDSKHTEILDPKDGYDMVASQYKDYHKHLNTFYHLEFLRFLPRKASFDMIDLGAGDGRMFAALNQIPHQMYVALDISKEMLLKHPRGPKHLVADLEKKLILEDESFDVAVSFFTLEHVENIEQLFSEIYRILRSEGQLFIGHFFQRREFVRTAQNRYFKIKQFKRTTEELQQLAEEVDFQVEIMPLLDKRIHTGDLIICRK